MKRIGSSLELRVPIGILCYYRRKMRLVIVESPTKAKTLQKFLGEGYEVLSSKGHLVDLPKKNLGVDVEHDFTPEYDQVPGKKEVITELKKAAAKAEEIFLATDPDREGEAIAWHIKQLIGDHKTKRVAFHEITEEAVKESFPSCRLWRMAQRFPD